MLHNVVSDVASANLSSHLTLESYAPLRGVYSHGSSAVRSKPPTSNEVALMNLLARVSRFAISPLPAHTDWYAIPLRLMIGVGFMQHGFAKLARGPEDFVHILHAIGIPAAFLAGWATVIVEIVGGFLILLGAFVP